MTDNPNLRQFVDEMSSYSDDGAAPHAASVAGVQLPAIGHVIDIAGSGSQVHMHAEKLVALETHKDPSVAMSGQVGSQIKMTVGKSWLIATSGPCGPAGMAWASRMATSLAEADRDANARLTRF